MYRFVTEEDGIETIEFLGLVAVAVALVVVIAQVAGKIKDKSAETVSAIENIDFTSGG